MSDHDTLEAANPDDEVYPATDQYPATDLYAENSPTLIAANPD
jgi:hypothetical protein